MSEKAEMVASDARRARMEQLLDAGALRMVSSSNNSTPISRAGRTKISWKNRHTWSIRVRTGTGAIETLDHTWVEGVNYTSWV